MEISLPALFRISSALLLVTLQRLTPFTEINLLPFCSLPSRSAKLPFTMFLTPTSPVGVSVPPAIVIPNLVFGFLWYSTVNLSSPTPTDSVGSPVSVGSPLSEFDKSLALDCAVEVLLNIFLLLTDRVATIFISLPVFLSTSNAFL